MNDVLTSDFDQFGFNNGRSLAFLSFPSKQSTKQLSGSTDEAVKHIGEILDQLLMAAIEKRTAVEFINLRENTFPHCAGVMISLATLLRAVVPALVVERLSAQSLSEQESEFSEAALAAFGSSVQEQAIFTVWTLRKINDLSRRVSVLGMAPDGSHDEDARFLKMFTFHGLRTRFHLDCLTTSIRHNQPIFPEVLSEISNGLRSAVDAYAWMRQIVELRSKTEDTVLPFVDLDPEDREFVDASGRDMTAD